MKLQTYQYPKSSFLSIEKDLDIIISSMMKNERLKKLLYYTVPEALDKPNLDAKQTVELVQKNIKLVPKLYVDQEVLNYITINFDNFVPNATNPEFRDNMIIFDIICHIDQWNLGDFKLRPYKIAAELDTLFNDKHLSGIGTLQFMGATQAPISDEFAGIVLMYAAIHGEEDKKNMLNPKDEKQYQKDFEELING